MSSNLKLIASLGLILVLLCSSSEGQSKKRKKLPKPRSRQEVTTMGAGSNHDVEWRRNRKTGTLEATSPKNPDENYTSPLESIKTVPATRPRTTEAKKADKNLMGPIVGDWTCTSTDANGSTEMSIEGRTQVTLLSVLDWTMDKVALVQWAIPEGNGYYDKTYFTRTGPSTYEAYVDSGVKRRKYSAIVAESKLTIINEILVDNTIWQKYTCIRR